MKTGWECATKAQLIDLYELHAGFVRKWPNDALSRRYRRELAAEMKKRGIPLPQQQPHMDRQ